MNQYNYNIDIDNNGKRVDVFLTEQIAEMSRSQVQRLIDEGAVLLNNEPVKSNYRLRRDDSLICQIPELQETDAKPQNIPLDIIYEDRDLLVVNKPAGMVVHPAHGNYRHTLVNALLFHCRDLSGINGVLRPGIVHRIDKDTSGLLVVAKNDLAHQNLAQQLKEHSIKRVYSALLHGIVAEPGGIIDAPIGRDLRNRQKMAVILKNSKEAITEYHVLERYEQEVSSYTLVECRLKTGRTHQIRVHMSYIGHPVVGDPKYGPHKQHLGFTGQALHAMTLGFLHPRGGQWLEFSVKPPETFMAVLTALGSRISFTEGSFDNGDVGKGNGS